MAFPQTVLGLKTEFKINGTWTDVSTYVRRDPGAEIQRGRANEQGRVTAQTCSLILNNRDGRFSNRNPLSPYFGLLPPNTQMRVTAGTANTYLYFPSENNASYSNTADAASLDILGDIDIRIDVTPKTWRPVSRQVLASKYTTTGNQRSWMLSLLPLGLLEFRWTTDGSTVQSFTSVVANAIPSTSTRLSIKAFLDVDNGAAGKTCTFSTATTIGGSYTSLDAQTTAGITTIFSSSAPLTVGAATFGDSAITGGTIFFGKIHAMQLRNSATTLVANPDYTLQAPAVTGFTDSIGLVWDVQRGAYITAEEIRFAGEIAEFPQRWDKTGRDIYVPLISAGPFRRLASGSDVVRSPLYRALFNSTPKGYWSLEDGSSAIKASSAVSGVPPASTSGVLYQADDTLPGSDNTAQITAATSLIAGAIPGAANTGTAAFIIYFKFPALPASDTPMVTLTSSGTGAKYIISVGATGFGFTIQNSSGTTVSSGSALFGAGASPLNAWVGMHLLLTTSGGNVNWQAIWNGVATGAYWTQTSGGLTFAGSPGRFTGFTINGATALVNVGVSHIFISQSDPGFTGTPFSSGANGYIGENAVTRISRLLYENGFANLYDQQGYTSDSETMGRQTSDSLLNLLYNCQDADGGSLFECRDRVGIVYRTRVDHERQVPLSLDYSLKHLAEVPIPTDDDQLLANNVTVRMPNGAFAISTVTTGPKSILSSPNGVGTYSTDVTQNVYDENRLPDKAGWLALLGSWDDLRWPNIELALHRTITLPSTAVGTGIIKLDLGDGLSVANTPSWLPPGPQGMLVQGYHESISSQLWSIAYNTSPSGPWQTPMFGLDTDPVRFDATATTLGAGVTSTATSISLVTTAGSALWVQTATKPLEFPFKIIVAGEVMTVTAITSATSPQTATVTRSVNGIVKAQSISAPIFLYQPSYFAA